MNATWCCYGVAMVLLLPVKVASCELAHFWFENYFLIPVDDVANTSEGCLIRVNMPVNVANTSACC